MILQSIIIIKDVSENIIPRYDRPFYHNNETLEICYHVNSVWALRVSTHNILVQNVVCYIFFFFVSSVLFFSGTSRDLSRVNTDRYILL